MESKKEMKPVERYQANIRFNGKWTLCPECDTIEEALQYVARARKATHARNLECNIMEVVRYVPAQ